MDTKHPKGTTVAEREPGERQPERLLYVLDETVDGLVPVRVTSGDGWLYGDVMWIKDDDLVRVHHHEGYACMLDDADEGDGWWS